MHNITTLTWTFVVAFALTPFHTASAQTCAAAANQISGTVFRDYNTNGKRDVVEPAEPGRQIRAFDASGKEIAVATTNADGAYSLTVPDGTSVRIQLTDLPSVLYSGFSGSEAASSVVFATSPACNISFSTTNASQYCQDNPLVATSKLVPGDPLKAGTAAAMGSFHAWGFGDSGYWDSPTPTGPAPIQLAVASQTGATWGVAFHRQRKLLYTSAVAKRHAGFGPLGTGGIYTIDVSDIANPNVGNWLDLKTLGIDTGIDPREADALPADAGVPSVDAAMYAAVANISFGGMTLSEDNKFLYVTNLKNRTVYRIAIGDLGTTPTASDIQAFPVTNPGCSNGEFRPWAVNVHDGEIFVGVTCYAQTSQNRDDLRTYVLKLDEASGALSKEFEFALTYPRGDAHTVHETNGNKGQFWRPQFRTSDDLRPTDPVTGVVSPFSSSQLLNYNMPNTSKIQFDATGNMIVFIMDLSGLFFGRQQPLVPPTSLMPGDAGNLRSIMPGADILRVCRDSSGIWSLEDNASCGGITNAPGVDNQEGPGFGEYYFGDSDSLHDDTSMGAGFIDYNSNSIMITAVRPVGARSWSGGTRTLDAISGHILNAYEVYPDSLTNFAKAVGLGDLTALCDPAPLQIGNRVWLDDNRNGVQDAGEPPIAGVTLSLYDSAGDFVESTVTDANGEYYFRVEPDQKYLIRLDNPADFQSGAPLFDKELTAALATSREIDSDAVLDNSFPTISIATGGPGQNDHTFDIGFAALEAPVCANVDITNVQHRIDHGAKALERFIKNLLRLKNIEIVSAARKQSLLKQAHVAQHKAWTIAWNFTSVVNVCSGNVASCTTTSQDDLKAQFKSNNDELLRIFNKVAKRAAKVAKKRGDAKAQRKIAKISNKFSRQYQENADALDQIPAKYSC